LPGATGAADTNWREPWSYAPQPDHFRLAGAALFAPVAHAQTEPLGGRPPAGVQRSLPELEAQVAYQRALEALVSAMPASAIYRLRVGLTQIPGMADNVILAYSIPLKPKDEAITEYRNTLHFRIHRPSEWTG
jgi:hypothetical protein